MSVRRLPSVSKAVTRLSWMPVPLSDTRIAPVFEREHLPRGLEPADHDFQRGLGLDGRRSQGQRAPEHEPRTSVSHTVLQTCWQRVAGSYTSRSKRSPWTRPPRRPSGRRAPACRHESMPNSRRNPDEASVYVPNIFFFFFFFFLIQRQAEKERDLAFGRFVLDLGRGALLRDGTEVRLRAKSLDVLAYLVRHAGAADCQAGAD